MWSRCLFICIIYWQCSCGRIATIVVVVVVFRSSPHTQTKHTFNLATLATHAATCVGANVAYAHSVALAITTTTTATMVAGVNTTTTITAAATA